MSRRSAILNARLIYLGVALASGGIAFYVPLMLSTVGLAHSGVWAAGILFGTNLGRVAGSHVASRHAVFTWRARAIVANILLEGLALFSMAFLAAPWMLVAAATVAGLGSGLSFPGMKNAILRLDGLDPGRAFAGLSMSFRLGMVAGYLAGAVVGANHLVAVFTTLLAMFVAYAACMRAVLADIDAARRAAPAQAAAALPATPVVPAADAPRLNLALLLFANAAFWFLTIQPTVTMSLYVPRYVPGLPVSTSYWVTTVTILALQMHVTRRARDTAMHLAFLRIGCACMLAAFCAMALAGAHVATVVAASMLLALSQIFYGPSLDVLISSDARARGVDTGRMMARQQFWQNLGMMAGSLAAGVLFDAGMRWRMPAFGWIVVAAGALAMQGLVQRPVRTP